MVVKLGINEWPMPGRIVRRSTYLTEYHELTKKDGRPFVPGAVWKDAFFSAAIPRGGCRLRSSARTFTDREDNRILYDHHSDRAETGFLLPVALCRIVLFASQPGNTVSPDRPCAGNRRTCSPSILRGVKVRSELA